MRKEFGFLRAKRDPAWNLGVARVGVVGQPFLLFTISLVSRIQIIWGSSNFSPHPQNEKGRLFCFHNMLVRTSFGAFSEMIGKEVLSSYKGCWNVNPGVSMSTRSF